MSWFQSDFSNTLDKKCFWKGEFYSHIPSRLDLLCLFNKSGHRQTSHCIGVIGHWKLSHCFFFFFFFFHGTLVIVPFIRIIAITSDTRHRHFYCYYCCRCYTEHSFSEMPRGSTLSLYHRDIHYTMIQSTEVTHLFLTGWVNWHVNQLMKQKAWLRVNRFLWL